MPTMHRCTSGKEVVEVGEQFAANVGASKAIEDKDKGGYLSMANAFTKHNSATFKFMKNLEWHCAKDGDDVVGLLHLSVLDDAMHIDNVVALPGNGTYLVLHAKTRAIALGKAFVNLNAADKGLPDYYRRFGFAFEKEGSMFGLMVANASAIEAPKSKN